MKKLPFIITIDTEGDNLWESPKEITTKNSNYLPRFQELCEKYGFRPVYLTNWEMVNCPSFKEFAQDVVKRNTGEIGMHLHSWNSPPIGRVTTDDYKYQPFLIEYPLDLMRRKIEVMTKTLEDTFQTSIISHRAGRWAMNSSYFEILKDFGYKIDCSVTPHIDWGINDNQYKKNNVNYSGFPSNPYFVNCNDRDSVDNKILEVPVSIVKNQDLKLLRSVAKINKFSKRLYNYFHPELMWLRPNGKNIQNMLKICKTLIKSNADHAEFILHSSELMPGGSPTFRSKESIENLYFHMELLFKEASSSYFGLTLSQFREYFINRG